MKLEPAHQSKLQITRAWLWLRLVVANFLGLRKWALRLTKSALKEASRHDYSLSVFNKQIATYHEIPSSSDPLFLLAFALARSRRSLEDWEYFALQAELYRNMYVEFVRPDQELSESDVDFVVDGAMPARCLADLMPLYRHKFEAHDRHGVRRIFDNAKGVYTDSSAITPELLARWKGRS